MCSSDLAEFAYNNALNATTGVTPFFANKGYHPNLSVHPKQDLTSIHAQEYSVDLASLHQFLCDEMHLAQECYQGPADSKQIPAPTFEIGSSAFVKAKYFCSTRPSQKLSKKNLGPFEIIAWPGSHSCMLQLPQGMKAMHPVFHVSQLEPAIPNTIPNCVQPPPLPVEIEGEPEYKIAKILDSKIDWCHCNCKLLYLVCWLSYKGMDEETSWLLAMELGHASNLISNFYSCYPSKLGPHSA